MKKEAIILVGGGGHCRSVIDVVEQLGLYHIAGIVDQPELIGSSILGYEVIGCDDDLVKLHKQYKQAIITVGQVRSNAIRLRLYEQLKSIGYQLPVVVSPLAYLSRHASVGEGCVIMHHALVNAGAMIGENSIINTKALIEHDVVVGAHSHISTATVLNGGVKIAPNSFVGSNTTSKEGSVAGGFIKAGGIIV